MSKRPYQTPKSYRDYSGDLYEESYWDSVGREKPEDPVEPKHPGGRPKGSKDATPRRRRYAKKPTTEVSDGSTKEKRNNSGGNNLGRS